MVVKLVAKFFYKFSLDTNPEKPSMQILISAIPLSVTGCTPERLNTYAKTFGVRLANADDSSETYSNFTVDDYHIFSNAFENSSTLFLHI